MIVKIFTRLGPRKIYLIKAADVFVESWYFPFESLAVSQGYVGDLCYWMQQSRQVAMLPTLLQNHELAISLNDINSVDRYKTLGLINNGLIITRPGNGKEKFVVEQAAEWMNQLTTRRNYESSDVSISTVA